jgi:hypothetical protein
MHIVAKTPEQLLDYCFSDGAAKVGITKMLCVPSNSIITNTIMTNMQSYSTKEINQFVTLLQKHNISIYIDHYGSTSQIVFYNDSMIVHLWNTLCDEHILTKMPELSVGHQMLLSVATHRQTTEIENSIKKILFEDVMEKSISFDDHDEIQEFGLMCDYA